MSSVKPTMLKEVVERSDKDPKITVLIIAASGIEKVQPDRKPTQGMDRQVVPGGYEVGLPAF